MPEPDDLHTVHEQHGCQADRAYSALGMTSENVTLREELLTVTKI
jgi:hypothetical protein